MNKRASIISIILTAAILLPVSCTTKLDEEKPEKYGKLILLREDDETLLFHFNDPKTVRITVESEPGVQYQVYADEDWVVISDRTSSGFRIGVYEYPAGSILPRTSFVRVSAEGALEQSLTITQNTADQLSVNPIKCEFKYIDDIKQYVTITTNAATPAVVTADDDWVILTGLPEKEGTIFNNFSIGVENYETEDTKPRTSTVRVNAGTAREATIEIVQNSKYTEPGVEPI